MAMIYNVTEIVKDWLIDRNKPKIEVGNSFNVLCVGRFPL